MEDFSTLTREQLIDELRRLRTNAPDAGDGNGKFDEDELFDLAKGVNGDQLFLVTDTGRFVYVNDSMIRSLGYSYLDFLDMSLARIDKTNSRATWLHRVSQLRQTRMPDTFTTQFLDNDGEWQSKEVTALSVTYRGKSQILCVARDVDRQAEPSGSAYSVAPRSREQIFLQTTSDGVLIVDTRGTIIETNGAADRLFGMHKSEMVTRSCIDPRWRLIDADGSAMSVSNHPIMIALVEEHPVLNRKMGMIQADGSRRFLIVNAAPLFDGEGELTGAVGFIRPFEDSAERHDTLKRELANVRTVLEAIRMLVDCNSANDLERGLCELLFKRGHYPLVWRGVTVENDPRVQPIITLGQEADYLLKIKIRHDESEHGNGPIGLAIRNGETVVVADLLTDPASQPWKNQADKANLHSMVALPLQYQNENYGVIAVYHRDRNHFVGPELEVLKDIARIGGFGMSMLLHRQESTSVLNDVRSKVRMLEAYTQEAPVAYAVFDSRIPFRCLETNRVFHELLDEPYRSRGIEGQMLSDVLFGVYHRDIYHHMSLALESRKVQRRWDDPFQNWSGETNLWSWAIVPILDDEGEGQLLYLAWSAERAGGTGDIALTQEAASPAAPPSNVVVETIIEEFEEFPVDTPTPRREVFTVPTSGVLRLRYPKLSTRLKPSNRVQKLLDEGEITYARPVLEGMPWTGDDLPATPASAVDAERLAPVFEELVSTKHFPHHMRYRDSQNGASYEVTMVDTGSEDGHEVWLLFAIASEADDE